MDRAQDLFEVIGYTCVTGTATDFTLFKEVLTNCFLVVRNRSEQEAEFYCSIQAKGDGLCREVLNPTTKAVFLQLVAKYEERHGWTGTYGSRCDVRRQEWDSRSRSSERLINGNWLHRGVVNRQFDARDYNDFTQLWDKLFISQGLSQFPKFQSPQFESAVLNGLTIVFPLAEGVSNGSLKIQSPFVFLCSPYIPLVSHDPSPPNSFFFSCSYAAYWESVSPIF
ncbi:hypothetical protein TNCV_4259041 [Trichonephila clavipes]|nr:hypothetical protein TNCV_4259041 [Trichonephila clavipes]